MGDITDTLLFSSIIKFREGECGGETYNVEVDKGNCAVLVSFGAARDTLSEKE